MQKPLQSFLEMITLFKILCKFCYCSLKSVLEGIYSWTWTCPRFISSALQVVPTLRVHPRCAYAHNCLGPTLGKIGNTKVSFSTDTTLLIVNYTYTILHYPRI